ncbi:hypothetical protein K439DRAFT_1616358 [Ramaria rubella]|nr:hypothetical protein K439DRAFT_1616358 [Ramaria rubella]
MWSSQDQCVNKILQVTVAIREAGWCSFNEFLLPFYTSNHPTIAQQAGTGFQFRTGHTFAPEALLDAWLEQGPMGQSQKELQMCLTCKTATILVQESTAACWLRDLCLPAAKLDNKYLVNNFALETTASLYLRMLPSQYEHELPPLLREAMEHTWLVNCWGQAGCSIPTDLYLEHNNGFIQNSFAAMGSVASMEYVQTCASAPVEVFWGLSHELATSFWSG